MKQYRTVLKDFDQAIRLDSQDALAYNDRGVARFRLGEHTGRGIEEFGQAISLDSKYALAYNNRGLAYDSPGFPQRAKADMDKACQLDKKFCTITSVIPMSTRPRPAVFGGSATLKGLTAPNGTIVTAIIDGTVAATTNVTGGYYAVSIVRPSASLYEWRTFRFRVGGFIANPLATWRSGGWEIVNLAAE